MKEIKNKDLFDFSKTIGREIFQDYVYPWEVISKIKTGILEIGENLSLDEYDHPNFDVWISKLAKIFPTVYIEGPCIIDHGAELRHCSFIRGSVIIGKNAVVGNSTELKNTILFDEVKVPHYNYVGDSILGFNSHMGAGSITSNLKSDKSLVKIKNGSEVIETGLKKIGAFLGDNVEVGCNSVLFPGSIVGKGTIIYPLSRVRGVVPAGYIYKDENNIFKKVDNLFLGGI